MTTPQPPHWSDIPQGPPVYEDALLAGPAHRPVVDPATTFESLSDRWGGGVTDLTTGEGFTSAKAPWTEPTWADPITDLGTKPLPGSGG